MGERIIVSGDGGVSVYTAPPGGRVLACRLCGAGAVCGGQRDLYVADNRENAIWRIDAKTLMTAGIFPGGPGISQMLLSQDEKNLYALCAEADSLLMLCAVSGAPKLLCRVGVNPCAMAMNECGDVLAVAGGASGEVILLDAHSLHLIGRLATCGMVFSVAVSEMTVYALSLTETMDSVLTEFLPDGSRRAHALPGMPGAICVLPACILAATHLGLYCVSRDANAVSRRLPVPGRAGRLWAFEEGLLMTDMWTERLFWRGNGMRRWSCVAQGVKDAAGIKLSD